MKKSLTFWIFVLLITTCASLCIFYWGETKETKIGVVGELGIQSQEGVDAFMETVKCFRDNNVRVIVVTSSIYTGRGDVKTFVRCLKNYYGANLPTIIYPNYQFSSFTDKKNSNYYYKIENNHFFTLSPERYANSFSYATGLSWVNEITLNFGVNDKIFLVTSHSPLNTFNGTENGSSEIKNFLLNKPNAVSLSGGQGYSILTSDSVYNENEYVAIGAQSTYSPKTEYTTIKPLVSNSVGRILSVTDNKMVIQNWNFTKVKKLSEKEYDFVSHSLSSEVDEVKPYFVAEHASFKKDGVFNLLTFSAGIDNESFVRAYKIALVYATNIKDVYYSADYIYGKEFMGEKLSISLNKISETGLQNIKIYAIDDYGNMSDEYLQYNFSLRNTTTEF